MLNKKFIEAIKIISKKLNGKVKWSLIASTNLALQGMDVKPQDLDIVVRFEDLKKMPELFSDYNASEVKKIEKWKENPAWEVKLDINGVEVQILGENDNGEYVSKLIANKLTKISLEGSEIPCFTLKAEIQTYEETSRNEKAERIKSFLSDR